MIDIIKMEKPKNNFPSFKFYSDMISYYNNIIIYTNFNRQVCLLNFEKESCYIINSPAEKFNSLLCVTHNNNYIIVYDDKLILQANLPEYIHTNINTYGILNLEWVEVKLPFESTSNHIRYYTDKLFYVLHYTDHIKLSFYNIETNNWIYTDLQNDKTQINNILFHNKNIIFSYGDTLETYFLNVNSETNNLELYKIKNKHNIINKFTLISSKNIIVEFIENKLRHIPIDIYKLDSDDDKWTYITLPDYIINNIITDLLLYDDFLIITTLEKVYYTKTLNIIQNDIMWNELNTSVIKNLYAGINQFTITDINTNQNIVENKNILFTSIMQNHITTDMLLLNTIDGRLFMIYKENDTLDIGEIMSALPGLIDPIHLLETCNSYIIKNKYKITYHNPEKELERLEKIFELIKKNSK